MTATVRETSREATKSPAATSPPPGGRRATGRRHDRIDPTYYLFLLPGLILFSLFITLPGLVGMFFSFTNYAGYGNWHFVGFTNYKALFSDPRILDSYQFTLLFA